jgi:tagatose 1,6-diphosphate aldolase
MANPLSPGKWQRLRSLTDEHGRFKMLAIDQRDSLRRAIARAVAKEASQVGADELSQVKVILTKTLAPHATALLTDPVYGYPQALPHLPPRVGLLLAYEETGYEKAGAGGKERQTHLIDGWSVEQAVRIGADAVKLLIYYHPDASEAVRKHQQELVQRVGAECQRADVPFLLELVSYPLQEDGADSAAFARRKPDLVIRSAAEFSQPHYGVDILKLEFPADLKWTREFAAGAFDGRERQAVYTLAEVRSFCQRLNDVAGVPWVILSAGVAIEEFLVQVDLAAAAGASGFLCGRAIWQDAIPLYPDTARMEQWLADRGVYNFVRANAAAHRALPWFCHRRFAASQA